MSWRMRELTKQEKKLFDCYVVGYKSGLEYVPPNWVNKYQTIPFDEIVPKIYKEDISFFKRRKDRYEEYKKGFVAGYFKSISSEVEISKMDPTRNDDIYSYLESLWLYHRVYGTPES